MLHFYENPNVGERLLDLAQSISQFACLFVIQILPLSHRLNLVYCYTQSRVRAFFQALKRHWFFHANL